MSTEQITQPDTFDADLAELHQIADRLFAAIQLHGGIDYARTMLAASNIGCGITNA